MSGHQFYAKLPTAIVAVWPPIRMPVAFLHHSIASGTVPTGTKFTALPDTVCDRKPVRVLMKAVRTVSFVLCTRAWLLWHS